MRYHPRDYTFRAVLWRGELADLPSDWLAGGRLSLEPDDRLTVRTLHGPSIATPDGTWYIAELPSTTGEDELYPVRRDIFEAKYEAVE